MPFCFFCGTAPVILISTHQENKIKFADYHCMICEASYSITVLSEAQITQEEAEAVFNKIPLTDKKAKQAAKRNKKIQK